MSDSPARKTLIECHAIGLRFGQRRVIENFSLKIQSGDRIAFLGPSGCGKSTLLNLISGLLIPSEGRVERHLPAEKISFVFQDASLFPWKTVRSNLELVHGLIGSMRMQSTQLDEKIEQLLRQVGLSERAHAYPDELSGGMKMRVALARALVNAPQLLLLDEPFAALDDLTRERLQEDLLNLQAGHDAAFVLVTHNISEALYLCDRIFVFAQNGRILKEYSLSSGSDTALNRADPSAEKIHELRQEIRQLWGQSGHGESNHA